MLVIWLKREDYNTKVTEIENKLSNHNQDKYIDTQDFNKLTVDVFNARLAQASLILKTDFDAKLSSLNRKITQNKSKHLLVENELNKLKTFNSSYFIGKNYFKNEDAQNYLVFQPMLKYLKESIKTDDIFEWKSKGFSDAVIKPPDNTLAPTPGYDSKWMYLIFDGGCLKQDKVTYNHNKIVNIYIVYDLKSTTNYNPDFNLENCLFGAVKIIKNTDVKKYKYSEYGIRFDGKGVFSYPTGSFGNNAIIFGVDMSYSARIDNKKKDILILGKGTTQGLGEHSLTAEKMHSINFSAT